MNFKQATVFLTGANRGLGRALVEELTRQGVKRVYAATRKPADLPHNDLIVPVKLDITDRQAIKAAAQQAADTTILINNAGALAAGNFLEAPLDLIARDLETNYYGSLNLIRAFAPVLEQNGGGAIANVLSVVALASMPSLGGYSASKAAAFSMTQALRATLQPKGIRVHAIFPGPVDTEMAAEVDLPKTPAHVVASAILEGMKNGVDNIFPDPMAAQVSQIWLANPQELERQFASA